MNETQKKIEVNKLLDEMTDKKLNGIVTVKSLSGQIVHIEKTESTHFHMERIDKK